MCIGINGLQPVHRLTVDPLSVLDTTGTAEVVLHVEMSLTQGLLCTLTYYCGTRARVFNKEVCFIDRVSNKGGSSAPILHLWIVSQ